LYINAKSMILNKIIKMDIELQNANEVDRNAEEINEEQDYVQVEGAGLVAVNEESSDENFEDWELINPSLNVPSQEPANEDAHDQVVAGRGFALNQRAKDSANMVLVVLESDTTAAQRQDSSEFALSEEETLDELIRGDDKGGYGAYFVAEGVCGKPDQLHHDEVGLWGGPNEDSEELPWSPHEDNAFAQALSPNWTSAFELRANEIREELNYDELDSAHALAESLYARPDALPWRHHEMRYGGSAFADKWGDSAFVHTESICGIAQLNHDDEDRDFTRALTAQENFAFELNRHERPGQLNHDDLDSAHALAESLYGTSNDYAVRDRGFAFGIGLDAAPDELSRDRHDVGHGQLHQDEAGLWGRNGDSDELPCSPHYEADGDGASAFALSADGTRDELPESNAFVTQDAVNLEIATMLWSLELDFAALGMED
jgi:hypothetical protein